MSSGKKMTGIMMLILMAAVLISSWGCGKAQESKYFAARVDDGDRWGMVDINGKFIVEEEWDNRPSAESEGFVYVKNDDGMYEYFKVSKKPIQIGDEYHDASRFSEGLAAVVTGKDDDKYIQFINHKGKMVIELKKLDGKRILAASRFNEGMAWVKNEEGKYGFIDKKGKLVIKCKYDDVDLFREDLAKVTTDNDEYESKQGFIDKKGEEVIKLQENRDYQYFSDGYCWFMVEDDEGNEKMGTINKKGEVVIKADDKYYEAEPFHNGIAIFSSGSSYGLVNAKGEELIRDKYDDMLYTPHGYVIWKGDKVGLINARDKEILAPTDDFDLMIPIGGGKYFAFDDDEWLIVNKKGDEVGKQSFKDIEFTGLYGIGLEEADEVSFYVTPEYDPEDLDYGDYGDYMD